VLAVDRIAATEKIVRQQQANLTFWSRYDTPLLYAWISDYELPPSQIIPVASSHDRDTIINKLVSLAVERPKSKKAADILKELQDNWREKSEDVDTDEEPPGLFNQPKDQGLQSEPEEVIMEDDDTKTISPPLSPHHPIHPY